MIIPEARSDQKRQRMVASAATAGGILVIALILMAVTIPERETERSRYRELDIERYVNLIEEPDVKSEQQPSQDESTEEQSSPERAVEEATPQKSVERIDMSDVMPQGLQVNLSPAVAPNRTASRQNDAASGGNTALRIEMEDLGQIGGFETLQDISPVAVSRGSRGGGGGTAAGHIAIAAGSGSGAGVTGGQGLGTGGALVGGSEGRAGNAAGTAIEVGLKDISDFGDNYASLDVKALIEWMKAHPAELPVGIKQHVGYRKDYLSSVVPFRAGGRRFELYLMCKEVLYEVHIVLVESSSSTYLIDRSFQKQSRYLRRGSVRRAAGEIVQVESQQKRASGDVTRRFYSIFLSWWEVARQEVQT